MSTDPFTTAARAEARTQFPDPYYNTASSDVEVRVKRGIWESGAVWARDHLARQEPTDAAVRAAMRVLYESEGPRDEDVIRSAIREAMKENR